jgi:hypothetical protein
MPNRPARKVVTQTLETWQPSRFSAPTVAASPARRTLTKTLKSWRSFPKKIPHTIDHLP